MLVEIIFISWSHITVKLGIVTHHCDISHPQIYDIACQFIAKILPRTQCLCDEQLCRLIISISRDINPGNCNVAVSQSSESFPQNSVISQFSRVIITSHHNVWPLTLHWTCLMSELLSSSRPDLPGENLELRVGSDLTAAFLWVGQLLQKNELKNCRCTYLHKLLKIYVQTISFTNKQRRIKYAFVMEKWGGRI